MIPITVISCKGFVAMKTIKLHNVFIITPSHSFLIFWIKFTPSSLPTRSEIHGILDYNEYKLELWERVIFPFNSTSLPPSTLSQHIVGITYGGRRGEERKGCVILRHLMLNKNAFSALCQSKKGGYFSRVMYTFYLIYLWLSCSGLQNRFMFTTIYLQEDLKSSPPLLRA